MSFTELDISTFDLHYDTVYSGGAITHPTGYSYFLPPTVEFTDATGTYQLQLDVTYATTTISRTFAAYSINDAHDPDTSDWHTLGETPQNLTGGSYTITIEVGLGIESWASAWYVSPPERAVLFEVPPGVSVTGARWMANPSSGPSDPHEDASALIRDSVVLHHTGATSLAVSNPTIQVGDYMIAYITGKGTISSPSSATMSWSSLFNNSGSGGIYRRAWYRLATQYDVDNGGTTTFNFGSSTAEYAIGLIVIAKQEQSWNWVNRGWWYGNASNAGAYAIDDGVEYGEADLAVDFTWVENGTALGDSTLVDEIDVVTGLGNVAGFRVGRIPDHNSYSQVRTVPTGTFWSSSPFIMWHYKAGEWQDASEVTTNTLYSVNSGVTNRYGGTNISEAGGTSPGDPSLLAQAITDGFRDWDGPHASYASIASRFEVSINHVGGAFGPWSTEYAALWDYTPWSFKFTPSVTGSIYPAVPPEASSYQTDTSDSWQVTGATVTLPWYQVNKDTTTGGAASGSWATVFRATTGMTWGSFTMSGMPQFGPISWDNDLGRQLEVVAQGTDGAEGESVHDVSADIYGAPGDGYVTIISEVTGAGGSGPPSITISDLGVDGGGAAGSAMIYGPSIVYTAIPPRYRLLYRYEAPPVISVGQLYVNLSTDVSTPNWVSVCPGENTGYLEATVSEQHPTWITGWPYPQMIYGSGAIWQDNDDATYARLSQLIHDSSSPTYSAGCSASALISASASGETVLPWTIRASCTASSTGQGHFTVALWSNDPAIPGGYFYIDQDLNQGIPNDGVIREYTGSFTETDVDGGGYDMATFAAALATGALKLEIYPGWWDGWAPSGNQQWLIDIHKVTLGNGASYLGHFNISEIAASPDFRQIHYFEGGGEPEGYPPTLLATGSTYATIVGSGNIWDEEDDGTYVQIGAKPSGKDRAERRLPEISVSSASSVLLHLRAEAYDANSGGVQMMFYLQDGPYSSSPNYMGNFETSGGYVFISEAGGIQEYTLSLDYYDSSYLYAGLASGNAYLVAEGSTAGAVDYWVKIYEAWVEPRPSGVAWCPVHANTVAGEESWYTCCSHAP